MKTDNELIAEFLGGYTKVGEGLHRFEDKNGNVNVAEHLEFHTSWDWLMPVVEKINSIHKGSILEDREGQWAFERVLNTRVNCEIEVVFMAVVEFIKYYNLTYNTKNI